MKTPAFAAAVNRDELREGAEKLGVDFDEHLAFVIAALEARGGRARAQRLRGACLTALQIIVLDGDETGQELLEQALRVLDPDVSRLELELERHDLSLEQRRDDGATAACPRPPRRCATRASASRPRRSRPRARTTSAPPTASCARRSTARSSSAPAGGSRARSGRSSGVHYPISVVRMAVGDAYGAEQWREGEEGSVDEVALRTERITRGVCRAVAEFSFRAAERGGAQVYGGPKWTVSPVYEGMLKEEMDAAAERHPDVDYQPVLIDATYAGLLSGAADAPLVIPALNRDGDCLSDLVMPMFGSIAGAESILLAFDEDFAVDVAMAEAPHGTAPSLQGKDLANPMAMILACAAMLGQAAAKGYAGRRPRLARDLREHAGDDGRRGQDVRPRRPGDDDGVHRRRDREDQDEGRDLVVAGLVVTSAWSCLRRR